MLFMCCVLLSVIIIKEYDKMYGTAKGRYEQGYEVCCFVFCVNFIAVVFRMDLQMEGNSSAKAPATGQ